MSRTPATDCDHPVVRTMFFEDARNALWHCSTCDLRFYPACRTCVDVGHRNVEHPAQARTAVPEIDARWSRLARLVQAAFTEWATTGARARYGETRLMNEAFALANELAATAPQEPEA